MANQAQAVKLTTPQQHQTLHAHWPNDCCLCRVERERDEARRELEEARGERDDALNAANERGVKLATLLAENERLRLLLERVSGALGSNDAGVTIPLRREVRAALSTPPEGES